MKKLIAISILVKICMLCFTMALGVSCYIALAESAFINGGATLWEFNKTKTTMIEEKYFAGLMIECLFTNRMDILRIPEVASFYGKNNYVRLLNTNSQSSSTDSRSSETFKKCNLRPMQGIVPYPCMSKGMLLIILFSIFLILGVFFFLLVRMLKNKNSQSEIPDVDYCQIAKIALEDLEKERLFEAGRVKEYYEKFALIIRSYLENTKAIPARCLTCEELKRFLNNGREQRLLEVLSVADHVKFGFEVPQKFEKDKQVSLVMSIFEEVSSQVIS